MRITILIILSLYLVVPLPTFASGSAPNSQLISEPTMSQVKYVASLKTNKAYCAALIDGMQIMDNFYSTSGNISTGFNATPYLENGKNDFGILIASYDTRSGTTIHRKDALCELKITAAFPDHEVEISSLTATANEDGQPTSITSKKYPEKHRTKNIDELGYLHESRLFEMKREVTLQGLPEWMWTKATPLHDTPENYEKLKAAYERINDIFAANDFKKFKEAIWPAMVEYAAAEDCTPEYYFATTGIIELFNEGTSRYSGIDWSLYKFKSFKNGRIVRLVSRQETCPAQYTDSDGIIRSYEPYFSMINGKLIITR